MNSTEALREFAEKYKNGGYRIVNDYAGNKTMQRYDNKDELLSDLTALISEDYVERAKYDEAVRQRDELREALKQIRDTAIFVRRGSMDAYKMQHTAEAAIKNTEG